MNNHISLAGALLTVGMLTLGGAAVAQDQSADPQSDSSQSSVAQSSGDQSSQTSGQSSSSSQSMDQTTKGAGQKAKARGKQKAARATADVNWIKSAAQGNMAEVELGNMAQQKASSPAVKAFAQKMVTDHGNMNNQVQQLAQTRGITMPTAVDSKDRAEMNRLSGLSGPEFDKAYMDYMVKEHKKDISKFQHEASNGTDPQAKALASQALPTLQQHLQIAEQTQSQLGQ